MSTSTVIDVAKQPEAASLSSLTAAREALREAIESRDLAQGEVREAEQAHRKALSRASELEDQIVDLERRRWPGQGDRDLVCGLLENRSLISETFVEFEALREIDRLRSEVDAVRAARQRLMMVEALRVQLAAAEARQ
jgi:hypothetical protein